MAGTVRIIDSMTTSLNPAVDQTRAISTESGSHGSATFYANVTAIGSGDTWQITLRWRDTAGNTVNVAISATFTTTGLKEIALVAPFTSLNRAIPAPNQIFYDNTVDGAVADVGLTATVYAMYGD